MNLREYTKELFVGTLILCSCLVAHLLGICKKIFVNSFRILVYLWILINIYIFYFSI